MPARLTCAAVAVLMGTLVAPVPAPAFKGPYASLVDAGDGFLIDVDVRWPSTGTPPTDATKYGITGNSLGGATSWSGALLTTAFATAVPFNRGWHAWTESFVDNGSIERQTGAAGVITGQGIPGEYPAAETQTVPVAAFGSLVDALATLDIPVMNQLAAGSRGPPRCRIISR